MQQPDVTGLCLLGRHAALNAAMAYARDKSHAQAVMPARAQLHELQVQRAVIMSLDASGVLPSGPHAMAVARRSPGGSSAQLGENKTAPGKHQHH